MSIRRLSPFMVNQIAAGEVVERPASVVKELVENAIDAEASRIRIEIDKGGHERIEVIDDGNGIVQEELPLALESHATSKITDPCDLDGVATMGFRGEALASITSVARVVVRSRTRDAAEASVIEGEGERREGPKPAAGPVGTSVAVHQLFGRVPARRKFLKSEAAEMRRITRIVHRLTMSHPDIAFTLISNGRTTLELKARKDVRRRILDVMGPELDEHMLDLDVTREGIRLWGLVGLPEVARPTSQHQQFYLNGRPISDRSVSHALREAYRGLIEPSRHPTAVLFLQVEPTRVDVNVHPAKTEVRFRDERLIHSIVRRGVLECLGRSDLTPDLSVAESSPSASTRPLFGSGGRSGGGVRLTPPPVTSVGGGVGKGFDAEAARELARDLSERPAVIPSPVPSSPVLQVHKTFLVTEDEHGMVIIDQHALHERVMFERLLARIESGPLPSQRLLVPEVIDADPIHLEGLEQISPLMERLGLEATPSGPRTIALHAVPVLLFERGVKAGSFLKDLLERAGEGTLSTTDEEEALREVLDMMACKAAVKAGDQLSSRELADLLEMRETVERSSNCPHGRPTSLRLSMEDLERQFGRR